MTDDAETIALKIRKAKTDPHPLPGPEAWTTRPRHGRAEAARPEAFNLLSIYAALSDKHAGRGRVTEFAGQRVLLLQEAS